MIEEYPKIQYRLWQLTNPTNLTSRKGNRRKQKKETKDASRKEKSGMCFAYLFK